MKLAEPNVELIHRYVELLQSIEEGLEYVEASFKDYSKTEGDLVLADVLDALAQLQSANGQLQVIFAGKQELVGTLDQFKAVIDQCFQLEGKMEQPHEKQEIVKKSIIPSLSEWKQLIEPHLQPYTTQ
ncbi:hypothetical protein ACFOU2_24855 [Bacillus songklensis]|uniref:DUF8042 domain-containing protein n=2 Tax=Bacillus songklensis TaxID=1069116 RepID=A0ABV8BAT8_9BACI